MFAKVIYVRIVLAAQVLFRSRPEVLVEDFNAVISKIRTSYKNLNVESVGAFGQGVG